MNPETVEEMARWIDRAAEALTFVKLALRYEDEKQILRSGVRLEEVLARVEEALRVKVEPAAE